MPIIVRYLLEFCETAREAGEMLRKVPSFMAHNVTMVDRKGNFLTAFLSPDRRPVIRQVPIATNHQGNVEWHNHARATATLERENFLSFRLSDPEMTPERLTAAFLHPPLYTRAYERGFGTIYTAAYYPKRNLAEFIWPDGKLTCGLDHFEEDVHSVLFRPLSTAG